MKLNSYNRFSILKKLSYSAFDWDDNILHMSTSIFMDRLTEGTWHPITVLPSEFALVRSNEDYRLRDNDMYKAFAEFKDFGPRGNQAFIEDIKVALKDKKYGPSWNDFLNCLKEASIFAIITARGHEYSTIQNGVEYIIDNCLTDSEKDKMYKNCEVYASIFEPERKFTKGNTKFSGNELIQHYLSCCKYYGVGAPFSQSFKNEFNLSDTTSLEECKQVALGRFIDICNDYGDKSNLCVSIGFSDDDKRNVEHIKNYFEKKSSIHINLKLNVFDTSNKESIRTKYVNGEIVETHQDHSLLKFNNFNSMANTLQNTTNDFSGYTQQQKAKVATFIHDKIKDEEPKKKILLRKKKKKELKK